MSHAGKAIKGYRLLEPLRGEPPGAYLAQLGPGGERVALRLYRLYPKVEYVRVARARLDAFKKATDSQAAQSAPRLARLIDFEMSLYGLPIDPTSPERFCFVTTELRGGETLADVLEYVGPGPTALKLGVALELAEQAAEALETLHRFTPYGHGNLRPRAFMLAPAQGDPSRYDLKLTGYAPLPGELGDDREALRYSWTPEWLRGATPERPADIYALGAILYHLLAGAPPFEVDSSEQAAMALTYGEPLPAHELRPDLPRPLAQTLARCLHRDPGERPTATQLREALADARSRGERQPAGGERRRSGASPEARYLPQITVLRDDRPVEGLDRHLSGAGLHIGSNHTCDIVLQADLVADSHVQVDWDGKAVWFRSLNDTGAVTYGQQRAILRHQTLWEPGKALHIGPYVLELHRAEKELELPAAAASPVANGASPLPQSLAAGLELRLEPAQLALEPGVTAAAELRVANRRNDGTVDTVALSMLGAPAAWVKGLPPSVGLNPGDEQIYQLAVTAPRAPRNAAGSYVVTARAESLDRPGEYQQAGVTWTVRPFHACASTIRPVRKVARGDASYRLAVTNAGNVRTTYRLLAEDPEETLELALERPRLTLEPGATSVIALRARPRPWHLLGPAEQRRFRVEVAATEAEARAEVDARYDQLPWLPLWLASALPVLLLLLAAGLYLARWPSGLDRFLMGRPAYGLFRPTPPPPPTAAPTATWTAEPVVFPPFGLPTATATRTPAARPTPIERASPQPPPPPTAPPTAAPTETPIPTPTPAPVGDGAMAFCPRGTPIFIDGVWQRDTLYRLRFHDYVVSLGEFEAPGRQLMTDGDGHFAVPLIVGDAEAPGVYRVRVETAGGVAMRTFYCKLLAPGEAPTATPTATPTPRPTATPFFTPTPTIAGRGAPAGPAPTPTFAPVADGDNVHPCPPDAPVTIAGEGNPGTPFRLRFGGAYVGEAGFVGPGGRFVATLPVDASVRGGVYRVEVEGPNGAALRWFYCDTFVEGTPTAEPATATPAPEPGAEPGAGPAPEAATPTPGAVEPAAEPASAP